MMVLCNDNGNLLKIVRPEVSWVKQASPKEGVATCSLPPFGSHWCEGDSSV